MSQATIHRDPSRRVIQWRRYDRAVVAAITAVVVILGVGVHSWLTGDHLFAGPGAIETTPVALGHTLYVGLGPLERGKPDSVTRINLRSITPLVTANSSGATVRVLECDARSPGGAAALTAGGVVLDDVSRYCAALNPTRTGAIIVGPRANGFVLAVTPRHGGVVRIDGARLSYQVGVRSGTQRIGAVLLTADTP